MTDVLGVADSLALARATAARINEREHSIMRTTMTMVAMAACMAVLAIAGATPAGATSVTAETTQVSTRAAASSRSACLALAAKSPWWQSVIERNGGCTTRTSALLAKMGRASNLIYAIDGRRAAIDSVKGDSVTMSRASARVFVAHALRWYL